MSLFSKFFNKAVNYETQKPKVEEQCLKLEFNYGFDSLDELYKLRDLLSNEIEKNELGDYDGHEIATDLSDGFMYIYGPSAKAIYDCIKPILDSTEFLKDGSATLILGEMGSECERIEIKL
jgi:hypothetical protein